MNTSTFREFARYASLNILGMLGLSCYILADTFFISQALGPDGLTALNLAIPIYSFIHGCGLMLGMGGGTRFSILKSQREHQQANRVFTNVLYLAAVFATLFVLTGLFGADGLSVLFGAQGAVRSMSTIYLRVILLFAPAFLANNVLLCFVRNDGAPHLSMAAMIGGSLSNVVLDWVFLFPCAMGIFGAVFATGLAPIISMMILSPHFFRKKNQFRPVPCAPSGKAVWRIVASGVPSLVTEVSSGIVIIVFNGLIMNMEGNIGVAAYGVIANLSLVVIAIYTGIAQGIQPILSRNYGMGNQKSLLEILRYAMISMLVISFLVYGAVWMFAPQISAAFNSQGDPTLQDIATNGLKLYFIACPFAGCNVVLSMYFTSIERPLPAHVISLLRVFFLIIPLAVLLSAVWKMTGIWCAFPVTEFLVSLLSIWLFFTAVRHTKTASR